MLGRNLIGVDIGTQGTKAAIFSESGRCLHTAFQKSNVYQPGGGIVEEDPEFQVKSVSRVIKECVGKSGISPKSVAAIGIDGQMAGIIGIGKDGRNVTCYDSWLDTRCSPYVVKMSRKAGDVVLAKTGTAPSFNHGPKILWWMHERAKTFKSIRSFVQPSGYAAMRLCGLDADKAFIDKTYLHFSGFADNKNSRWDTDLCRKFNLAPDKLPKIVAPHKIVGELTPTMARLCGLKGGVAVIAGCGDTVASFLACGATKEGICVDVAGTASVFAATTADFRPDKKNKMLGCGQAATPGLWHPYAYINGGGMNLEWFRRELANNGRTAGRTRLSFDKLNQLADKIPVRDDAPIFVPHLAGRVCPSQPALRGAWVGLNWSHTLADMYRAVLEGVALEYGIYRSVLGEVYPHLKLSEIRITGGGEKSELWNRIKTSILQIPVVQLKTNEGAPMGVAMLAGFGVGLFSSPAAVAKKWIQKGYRYRPDKKTAFFYRDRLKKYNLLLKHLNDFAEGR